MTTCYMLPITSLGANHASTVLPSTCLPLFSVVRIGFAVSSYTVNEGDNQVQVCVQLSGVTELAQPVQMRVTSSDGTATGIYATMKVFICIMFI